MGDWIKDGEGINQRTGTQSPRTWTMIRELTKGAAWVAVGGGRKKEKTCRNNCTA